MKLGCFAGVEYQNSIYFSSMYFNALCKMDLDTNEVEILKIFEKEPMYSRLYRQAFLYGNEAWFIPQRAKYIACVNLDTLDISYYDVPFYTKIEETDKYAYCRYHTGVFVEKDKLCIFPYDADLVLVIDMKSHMITPIYEISNRENYMIGIVAEDEQYKMFFHQCESVVCYHKTTGKISKEKMDKELGHCTTVLLENNLVMLSGKSNVLYRYQNNIMEEMQISEINKNEKYDGLIDMGDRILALPFEAKSFLSIDIKTGDTKRIGEEVEGLYREEPNKLTPISTENNRILISMGDIGKLVELDGEEIIVHSIEIDDEQYKEKYFAMARCHNKEKELLKAICDEKVEVGFSLEMFIYYVLEDRGEQVVTREFAI